MGAFPRLERRHTWDLNIVLGAWLIISAFAWAHSLDDALVTVIAGALILGSGVGGFVAQDLRHVEASVALLLVLSAVVVPHLSALTAWNNTLLGALTFALTFAKVDEAGHRMHWPAHHH
jgi:hypothetical protein